MLFSRLKIYFREMFPFSHISAAFMLGLQFFMAIALLNEEINIDIWKSHTMLVAWFSGVFLTFILRVMDEFKDYPDDVKNFPERPLPKGLVTFFDLKILFTVASICYFLLNLSTPGLEVPSLLLFGYALLMFKWFFIEEKMRSSLLLALLSHHPIVYLLFGYYFYSVYLSYPLLDLNTFWVMIPISFNLTNWEISRKIRLKSQEDSYTTYSRIFGFRGAIAITLVLQAIIGAGLICFLWQVAAPWLLILGSGSLMLLTMSIYLRFALTGKLSYVHDVKRPLRFYAELQSFTVLLSIFAAYLCR